MADADVQASAESPRFAAFRGRGLGRSATPTHSSPVNSGAEDSAEPSSRSEKSTVRGGGGGSLAGGSGGKFGGGRGGGTGGGHSTSTDDRDSSERPMFGGRGGSKFGGGQGHTPSGGFRRENGDGSGDENEGGRFGGRSGGFSDRGGRGGRSSDRGGRGGFSDRGGRGGFSDRGGRGGGFSDRGDRDGGFSGRDRRDGGFANKDGDQGSGDEEPRVRDESRPPPYVPPPPPGTEKELFKEILTGLNFSKYDDIPVRLTGREPVSPVATFEEANLYRAIMENVQKVGYKKPTPVQKYAMPVIMAGRDLMSCAQTGSGKTAAFLLPVMSRMMADGIEAGAFAESQSPAAIIVAPTRELVTQIWMEALKFSYSTMMRPVVLYGGTSLGKQLRSVEEGCHLVIATPGRLMDVINRRKIDLGSVKYLILDEADRMLDMGFLPTIQKLVEQLGMSAERQTLMFSATFPTEVQELAKNFLDDYLFLTVGILGGAASDVKQNVIQVEEFGKRKALIDILSSQGTDRTIVFVETKRTADFLASYLCQQQFPCTSIHGDRMQQEREEALRDFKVGDKPILVATSVASRGLDIQDVKHIVNFDLPDGIEDYVHRIGRTGRIGHSGLATSFFTIGKDEPIARSLVKTLSESSQDVPDWLEVAATDAVGSGLRGGPGGFGGQDMREHGGRRGGRGGRGGGDRGGGGGGRGFNDDRPADKSWSVGKSVEVGAAQDEENWD